jgi:HEAT repeat protein
MIPSMLKPFCISLLVCVIPLAASHAEDNLIDSPMYQMPDVPGLRVVEVFPEKTLPLWLKALERPEIDYQCRAADTVAWAHRRGVARLESAIAPLRVTFDRQGQHPKVRLAVAKALVELDARDAAPSLFEQVKTGSAEYCTVVEPALARWDYRQARALWLERLRDPATPLRSLVLAIRGLGQAREEQAAERLRELALQGDETPRVVRAEAAQALGTLRASGLEKDAESLATDTSPRGIVARLAAVSLLREHRSPEAVRQLQRLAKDAEPAVAGAALATLLVNDAALIVPMLDQVLANPDAKVRTLGVETLFRQPSEKHLKLLADRLDDVHPEVREKARHALRELAGKKDLRGWIIIEATRMLQTQSWRGLEQSAFLLTQLDHKPAAPRMLEMLPFDRGEVCVAAAWGLRKLAVKDTLPGVVQYLNADLDGKYGRKNVSLEMLDHEFSQLNQFLGLQKYAPAEAVLRRFIPRSKGKPGLESRAAAVWALGMLHEGKNDEGLAGALEERLNDMHSYPPEDVRVRRMSAITLGRMNAKQTEPSLRKYFHEREATTDLAGNACGWAIGHWTGESLPLPKVVERGQREWFLVPVP